MDITEGLRTQRAVREFADRPIPDDVLERILQAGAWAPSSMNEQRWRFIAITDRSMLSSLASIGDWAEHLGGAAAAIALVFPIASQPWEAESTAFDLGQAAQSLMLAAWDEGIGSAHASVYQEERARELLAYPTEWRCDTLLSFGYPADPTLLTQGKGPTARRPLGETVHRERW